MKRRRSESRPIVVAVIPARAGSKGFPGKNIFPVLGHPMIAWSIQAARECPRVTDTFVISDGPQILATAERYGAKTIREPASLGGDRIKNWQVLRYALRRIRSLGIEPDILVWLQPSSPQRTSVDLKKALALFDGSRAQAVISVAEIDNKLLKSFVIRNGMLKFLSDAPWPFMLRSDLPRSFLINGAIMAIRTHAFEKNSRLYADRTIPYIMPPERSIDIDYREQALLAAAEMRRSHRNIKSPIGSRMRRSVSERTSTRGRHSKGR